MSPERVQTELDGHELTLSHLEKVLYPETGFTKGQVLDYYTRIADVMVPHLRRRPATLRRFPDGVQKAGFYEKHSPSATPEWVDIISVPSKEDAPIDYLAVDDRATLLWAANLAALELHVPLWHVKRSGVAPSSPDYIVFDLDPGPGCTIVECCHVALLIANKWGEDAVFAKTSGSKGLQLYIRAARRSWESTRSEAHEFAQGLERDNPERVVSIMTKSRREGKILIDWSQNHPAKTTVAAYSLRARPAPTVSTPVTWADIHRCAKRGDAELLRFETSDVLRRVEKHGDLMAPLLGAASKTGRTT